MTLWDGPMVLCVTAHLKAEKILAGTLFMVRFSDVLPLQEGRFEEFAHQISRRWASPYRAREKGRYDCWIVEA
jgi:hypothetical protein